MKPYFYKLQEISTGKYYVGCQYGKTSDPANLWRTYFTSCQYILQKEKSDFKIVRIIERLDARAYEQKYLNRMLHCLGREKFLRLFINRNLAPGILLEGRALENLKRSLKLAWQNPKRKELHQKNIKQMIESGIYAKRKGISTLNQETRKRISRMMILQNPMKNETIRQKHKLAINTEQEQNRKRNLAMGNTYTKGKRWYNNGKDSKMLNEPTVGWVLGRLNPHWNHKRKRHE